VTLVQTESGVDSSDVETDEYIDDALDEERAWRRM
jgi:hypothetical protein